MYYDFRILLSQCYAQMKISFPGLIFAQYKSININIILSNLGISKRVRKTRNGVQLRAWNFEARTRALLMLTSTLSKNVRDKTGVISNYIRNTNVIL